MSRTSADGLVSMVGARRLLSTCVGSLQERLRSLCRFNVQIHDSSRKWRVRSMTCTVNLKLCAYGQAKLRRRARAYSSFKQDKTYYTQVRDYRGSHIHSVQGEMGSTRLLGVHIQSSDYKRRQRLPTADPS